MVNDLNLSCPEESHICNLIFFLLFIYNILSLNSIPTVLLYSSVKILKPFTPHSLLVYYNFNNEQIQENRNGIIINNEKYYKQGITGILPIKVNSDFFMQKIIFKQPMQPYRFYNQDNFPLINMSYNILNTIQKSSRGNSYDLELFLKLKNYNYNKQ